MGGLTDVERLELKMNLAGDNAAGVEVVDQGGLGAGVSFDGCDRVHQIRLGEATLGEKLAPSENGVQGRAEFVGDGGQELVF